MRGAPHLLATQLRRFRAVGITKHQRGKDSMPNMTGRPGYRTMEMSGGSSAPYLAGTRCVPLFCTLFNRGGNRRAFRLPGAAGDHFHCTVEPSPSKDDCKKQQVLVVSERSSHCEPKAPQNNCKQESSLVSRNFQLWAKKLHPSLFSRNRKMCKECKTLILRKKGPFSKVLGDLEHHIDGQLSVSRKNQHPRSLAIAASGCSVIACLKDKLQIFQSKTLGTAECHRKPQTSTDNPMNRSRTCREVLSAHSFLTESGPPIKAFPSSPHSTRNPQTQLVI